MSDQESKTDEQPSAGYPLSNLFFDLRAGIVVFLVALPLCLGIAQASNVPPENLVSGLLAGIIGGIVVGALSGSHTSVSGPAAGLTAIVAAQIESLTFPGFLLAVVIGGILQIIMGCLRAGELSAFFPSGVIKGLLAAIGVILILKQIPHLVGHDTDPEGDLAFEQPVEVMPDGHVEETHGHNTFTELLSLFEGDLHTGAAVVGISCLVLILLWGRIKFLKNSIVPGPLVVVLFGVLLHVIFQKNFSSDAWVIGVNHLVKIPVADSVGAQLSAFFCFPNFSMLTNSAVYIGGITIAIVASLETLLNLEAVDKLDTEKRKSPASRELVAQGCGNVISGMIGGLPMTSVIVRSSVNVNSRAKTKVSAIFHGILLVVCVVLLPSYLNMIPKAALAAILVATGFKLASYQVFQQMWKDGRYSFIPFIVTLVSIVLTDLLIGILIGMGVAALFILHGNLRRPIRRIVETHLDGEVTHVELGNQVSFLNRAALSQLLNNCKPGTRLVVDGTDTDYIDPDVLQMFREFRDTIAPAREVNVTLRGFREEYDLEGEVEFVDYSTRELQDRITPEQVLDIMREGNRRFQENHRLSRDINNQIGATAKGQYPMAVVLSCIDSRVPVELVLDLGIGDVFSVRVAGNVIGPQPLASIEYGVRLSGVKLVLVLGHTRCGAVTSSVELLSEHKNIEQTTGCPHLHSIVDEIEQCIDQRECERLSAMTEEKREEFIDDAARRNVMHTVREIREQSAAVREAVDAGQVMIVGAMYDIKTGGIDFLLDEGRPGESLATTSRS